MKPDKITLKETIIFLVVVGLFIFFGQSIGWRAAGVWQLVFSIKIIKERRIGVGWDGFEPSTYITGNSAVALGLISIAISLMLLFYPEQTVMKWSSN